MALTQSKSANSTPGFKDSTKYLHGNMWGTPSRVSIQGGGVLQGPLRTRALKNSIKPPNPPTLLEDFMELSMAALDNHRKIRKLPSICLSPLEKNIPSSD